MNELAKTMDNNMDKLEALLPKPSRIDNIRDERKRAVAGKSKSHQDSWMIARLIQEISAMEIEHRDRIQEALDAQDTVVKAYEDKVEILQNEVEQYKRQVR